MLALGQSHQIFGRYRDKQLAFREGSKRERPLSRLTFYESSTRETALNIEKTKAN